MGRDSIFFGRNPLVEALRAGVQVTRIHTKSQSDQRFVEDIEGFDFSKIPIKKTLPPILAKEPHQGVGFEVNHDFYLSGPQEVTAQKFPRILLCNHLHDIHNLGAISRSAAAFGFNLLVHEARRSFRVNPAAVKVSMGAAFHIRYLEVANLAPFLQRLQKAEYQLVGLDGASIHGLYDWNPPPLLGLVLGSEAEGISKPVTNNLDFQVAIPMGKRVESLNVSQAASIAMSWAHHCSLHS